LSKIDLPYVSLPNASLQNVSLPNTIMLMPMLTLTMTLIPSIILMPMLALVTMLTLTMTFPQPCATPKLAGDFSISLNPSGHCHPPSPKSHQEYEDNYADADDGLTY